MLFMDRNFKSQFIIYHIHFPLLWWSQMRGPEQASTSLHPWVTPGADSSNNLHQIWNVCEMYTFRLLSKWNYRVVYYHRMRWPVVTVPITICVFINLYTSAALLILRNKTLCKHQVSFILFPTATSCFCILSLSILNTVSIYYILK